MEKFFTIIVIVFPGVFAIDDNGDDMRTFFAFQAGTNVFEPVDHILGGIFTTHTRIGKADLIRDDPIAEENCHFVTSFTLNIVRAIKSIRVADCV